MKRMAMGFLLTLLLAAATPRSTADTPDVRYLVLVTMDGVRVEEMFGGLDASVLASGLPSSSTVESTVAYRKYWAPTREERRLRLMPFFWGALMPRYGWIIGDPESGARERLQNRHRFSYPGYAEILTGSAHDDVIASNEMGQNPYPSVLEFLRGKLGLSQAEVAVFASWGTMHRIVEHVPGTILVDAPAAASADRPDSETFEAAMTHLRAHRPRVLYISFDETDTLAHEGRYADLLEAMAATDRRLHRLWDEIEADPVYRGRTALIVTVDHGRGAGAQHWHQHGADVASADNVWTAYVVPGSLRRGPLSGRHTFVHAQLAATMASILGADYAKAEPAAAPPIAMF
jgi:Type I phosphodiesterase / nucleotide pyrophosphatase